MKRQPTRPGADRSCTLCVLLWVASSILPACGKPATDPKQAQVVASGGRSDQIAAAQPPGEGAGGVAARAAEVAVDPELIAGFCDKHWPAGAKPLGAGPAATARNGAKAGIGGWRWLNFWATWCKPCLEEMPMLGRWRDGLVKDGVDFTLELWSVDEDAEALAAREAKGLPGPVWQVASASALGDWLESLGADREAVLPIHALVDPKGDLRCLRLGSVRPADYPKVRKLVGR